MNEPTTANAASPDDFENLRKQLEDLNNRSVFLHLPSLALSIMAGAVFGTLAFKSALSLSSALLIALAVSIASVALNEASHLRKHTDAILALLDNQSAASRPEQAQ